MKMRSIFIKPVDRPIEGVIKADDEAMLRTEFEEYVLTNEVQQKLENFLDMYTRGNGANGTWIPASSVQANHTCLKFWQCCSKIGI
jgi:hypothetical protein